MPKHALGQNFLIDDNILRVILGHLEPLPEDVALEVGAGLGVLTLALAGATAHVHAFEVDRDLAAPLAATLEGEPRVTLHFKDILDVSLSDLTPAPTVCASNLPYSVAASFLIRGLQELPTIRRYCVMVQHEVAERMAASPGTKVYGVLSVWVQLYARVAAMRPLSRSIFYPKPRVDSSLVVLDRRPGEQLPSCGDQRLREVVQAAFGQRRKTLVNSLSSGLGLTREAVQAVTERLGLPAQVRAERLSPEEFVALAEALR